MIRVGFLGCAHVHAAVYRDELRVSPRGRATAVFDHDRARATAFAAADELSVAQSAEHLCSLVDAVIVTSEHTAYAGLVTTAAAAGVPVLCEKPLGVSAEAAATIQDSGAWLSVAFPVRYAHPVRQAKAEIERGGLGRLLAMSGTNHGSFPGGFFGSRAAAGGGALIDHVVHVADALRWLTGCEYRAVYAEAGRFAGVGDVEDAGQVTVTTTGGAWATIDPSWSRPAGMPGANDLLMTLWFEHGQLSVDAFARHASLARADGSVAELPYGRGMDAELLDDWLRAIECGAPPPVPGADGWKATQVALAALRSADEGRVIPLNPAKADLT
ncbi:Gfo/Idh/MocA family oxidoreductase [Streptomyces sp. NPDC051976]|uniref:Gfo/Idh/MocA family protein n=1 Tax=Streptomyces sp. NPDC051976 TaxID=3154947 RepID=UPI0034479B77